MSRADYRLTSFQYSLVALLCLIVFATLTRPVCAAPVYVVDQRGKSIELASPAERMVIIPIPMTSVVMALDGSSRRLIGIHPAAHRSIRDGFLNRIFPEALEIQADVVRGGRFNPNLESILKLRPDVVVQWIEPPELVASLEEAGIKTVGLINSPPTQEINERNLTIMATVIGRLDRLDELLDKHHRFMRLVSEQAALIPSDKKTRVLYFHHSETRMSPGGSNTYQDFWINLVGGINVAAGQFKGNGGVVNTEQIIEWNPDIIFLGAFDGAVPEQFMAKPELQGVSAVRNKRVYKMPHGGYRWDPGSHESFLTWQWASMVMHPEYFDFDLRSNVKDAYRFLYNYSLTDDEVDEILQMKANGGMAGYERFKR